MNDVVGVVADMPGLRDMVTSLMLKLKDGENAGCCMRAGWLSS